MMDNDRYQAVTPGKEILDTIRKYAAKGEKNGRLAPEQLEIIYRHQWFKILVPEAYGGWQMPLPDVLKLEEAISRADGSTGWVVTLCAGAGWFGGFLDPAFAQKIFSDAGTCLAGSGAPTGIAEQATDGYKVTGRWMHASGAPDATVFTANCIIRENNEVVKNKNGDPLIVAFAFLRDEVNIIPTWNSMGMKATASHAYEVTQLHVPTERAFYIGAEGWHVNAPLYRYPFLQLAEATLAVNVSGMAMHFLDLCEELFKQKHDWHGVLLRDNNKVKTTLLQAQSAFNKARSEMYEAADASWAACVSGNISSDIFTRMSVTAHALSAVAMNSVSHLYPFCGLTAADQDTELNRVWRDLHTASQHSLLAFGSM